MITVYFETTGYAEIVAIFAYEGDYIACLPSLEKQAQGKKFMMVTESVTDGDIRYLRYSPPERKQFAHESSAVRYIKNFEKKNGKQNFVINRLDENCFEVENCIRL
jgi:hypothetical protein